MPVCCSKDEQDTMTSPFSAQARIALVTAGAGGLGRATVAALLEQGMRVIAADVDQAGLDTLRDVYHTPALHTIRGDLTKPADVARIVAVAGELGGLHVLVNSVGSTCGGGVRDLALERWQRMFDLNLTSVLLTIQAALPLLEATSGDRVILNISSTLAAVADPTTLAYGAFKAGLEQLTRSLALELAPHGIRAIALAPGPVAATAGEAAYDSATFARLNPLGRFATAEEIGAMLAWLASPAATYITGTTIRVDGGDSTLGAGWGPLQSLIGANE